MTNRCKFNSITILACSITTFVIGCQYGPNSLRVSHAEYNEAIQHASAEQLLLNLVRLRYREMPMVLDVGSISAQFEISQSLGIAGTLNENVGQTASGVSQQLFTGSSGRGATITGDKGWLSGHNPDQLSLSGQFGYAERPTVTYTPLQGLDFAERMMTPISLPIMVKLMNSGWRIDRVLSLTVEVMNGLDNASAASGPTPEFAPEFEGFLQLMELMRALQIQRAISFEYESVPVDISQPILREGISPEVALQAAAANCWFRRSDDGRHVILTQKMERPILRLNEANCSQEQLGEFRGLLRLAADCNRYPLVEASSHSAGLASDEFLLTEIVLDTRSLIGVMFFLSQGVETPSTHARANLVTNTHDKTGRPFEWSRAVGHLLRIHESRFPPTGSTLSVRRGAYWFHIRDDDLSSKSTFLLLGQLFALRAGSSRGTAPLLTLPLGG